MPNPSTVTAAEPSTTAPPRLVIIHDTDADGISSAWAISHFLSDDYDETVFIPQQSGENTIPEWLLPDDSVIMVDRTYPWETLLALSQQVFSVVVIDHHKSAMTDYYTAVIGTGLYELDEVVVAPSMLFFEYSNITINIDTNHSACVLAWKYGVDHATDPDPDYLEVPWFLQYIEDRDIWKWELQDSKAINAGMYYYSHGEYWSLKPPTAHYDSLYNELNDATKSISQCCSVGTVVLNTQLQIIKGISHGPTVKYETVINPSTGDVFTVAVVCCPFSLISDLGNYMLNDDTLVTPPHVVLCYNNMSDGSYAYSIRSKHDMIWLAKLHNGGGHANACGFKSLTPPSQICRYSAFLANN